MKNTLTKRIPALLGMCLLLAVSQCWATQNYTFYRTGTATTIVPGTNDIGNHCDDCVTNIAPSFNYTFYGVTYDSANGITNDSSSITTGVQKDSTEFSLYQFNTPGTLASGMSMTTTLEPTDAQVVIAGQVTTSFSEGISGARVTLTDGLGISRTVLTGKFGNFRFNEVPSGAFYILKATARGYRFDPKTLPVTEDIIDIIFTPRP